MFDLLTNKFLLVLLCVITLGGFFYVFQALKAILIFLESHLSESIAEAICEARSQEQREMEQAKLVRDIEQYEDVPEIKPSEPFVFTIDAETAKLMQELRPGSMSGWEESK